jgi:hypothetical protein
MQTEMAHRETANDGRNSTTAPRTDQYPSMGATKSADNESAKQNSAVRLRSGNLPKGRYQP